MQLQKLVYFAHGWYLAAYGDGLTSDDPLAWDYGPVYRDLWEHAKTYGRYAVDRLLSPDLINPFFPFLGKKSDSTPYTAKFSKSEKDTIKAVWSKYKHLSAFAMSDLTHADGTPWSEVYFGQGKGASIKRDLIEKHYLKLAGNEP